MRPLQYAEAKINRRKQDIRRISGLRLYGHRQISRDRGDARNLAYPKDLHDLQRRVG